MNRIIVFALLFLIAIVGLLAKNRSVEEYYFIAQDTIIPIETSDLEEEMSIATPTTAITASTMLDEYGNAVDTSVVKLPKTYAWRIDPRYGDRILTPMDTLRENFHRSVLVEGQGMAMSYLGNIGGPVQSKDFFARKDNSQFPFMDVYEIWRRSPEKQLFLNTKVPYSNVQYQAGGGKEVAENRFKAELSSNFRKRLNVGFNFDYIYTRGYYNALFNKQTSYDFNASYIGDKYKMHIFVGNNNLQGSDNGGILDDRYITNPEAEGLTNIRGSSLDIPAMFEKGIRNRYRGRHLYLTNSYDIGKDKEYIQLDDSTGTWRRKDNYIAPASIILTTHYQDQRRTILMPSDIQSTTDPDMVRFDSIYVPNRVDQSGALIPQYQDPLDDYMSHYTLKNTLAFRMNEGFKDWTKFGLTAFIEHEMRRFLLPSLNDKTIYNKVNDDALFFGGKLTKNQGKYLKFEASALKGLNISDLELEGKVYTQFSLFGKEVSAKANVYFKNNRPTFFQENFFSRNWVIEKKFNDTKRIYGGGEILLPKLSFSETSISGGYENITDYIYVADTKIEGQEYKVGQKTDTYRRDYLQSSKSVNVFSLKLNQKLQSGIFHLDFQALLQKSTEEDIIPLPLWTVYGNVYLQTMVSKVLTVQIGVDGYMHEKYYAPKYDILLGQFYNQRNESVVDEYGRTLGKKKIGRFPHANIYVNLHLKYTRFFIMAYNVAEGFGNGQSFATPDYPTNPFMVRWGLSWKFNN